MQKDKCIINPERALDKDGYPRVKFDKRAMTVARMLLILQYGREYMKNKLACHTCGNRACVNPGHIYAGTPQDNSDDKWKDGTMLVGELSPRFRRDVSTLDAYYRWQTGESQQAIADSLGISQSALSTRFKRHFKHKKGELKDD